MITSLNLKQKQTVNTYSVGTSVSDSVNYVDNNQKIYRFNVAEKTQINLATLGNGLDYILKPTYSTTALWTVSAGNAYANQVITLDAGSYDFVIQNNFNYENITRQFNFTITDLKQALDLPLDQNISKTVNQSAEATVWKLTGVAGQNWVVDIRNIGQPQYAIWNLYDQDGNKITSYNQYYNYDYAIKVNLKKDGIYYLALQGSDEAQRKQQRTATVKVSTPQVIAQNVQLNQTMSGTLSEAGELHRYKLHLDQAQTVILDSVSGGVGYANLIDVKGNRIGVNLSSNQYQVVSLPAGDHSFEFYSDRTGLGAYQLRLLSLKDNNKVVHSVERLKENLAANQNLAIYAFSTNVGKKYNVDFVNSNNLYYTVFDESGNILLNNYYSNNGAPSFTSNADTLYVVVKRSDTTKTEKQLNVYVNQVESKIQPLVYNQGISGQLVTSDSTHSFQLNMEKDGWLSLNDLKLDQSTMYLRLYGASNNLISQYNNLTTLQSAKVYVKAGVYRLEISSNTDNDAVYQFNASFIADDKTGSLGVNIASAKELFIEGKETLSIDQPAQTDRYYRVMLNQGDQLFARLENSQIVLLDKNGAQLNVLDQEGTFSITSTGVYYLKISSTQELVQQGLYFERQSLKLAVPVDAGDTLATAQEIFVAQGTQFTLETEIGDGPNTNKDVDMYQLMLTAGDQLVINTYTSTNYLTRIFNASGQQVFSTNYGDTNNNYFYNVSDTGVYYIGLSGSANRNYNATDNTNLVAASTGQNTIQIARRIGALKPFVNYVLSREVPNDFVSEQSWSGVVANSTKDLDLFYFKVEEAGLYYLDRIASSWEFYNYGSIKVVNLQDQQQVLSNSNALIYLSMGDYVVRGKSQSNSASVGFKWMVVFQKVC